MLARLMVGVVTSTHGLKGEVNIFPTTDDVGRYDYLERNISRAVRSSNSVGLTASKEPNA